MLFFFVCCYLMLSFCASIHMFPSIGGKKKKNLLQFMIGNMQVSFYHIENNTISKSCIKESKTAFCFHFYQNIYDKNLISKSKRKLQIHSEDHPHRAYAVSHFNVVYEYGS